MPADPVGRSIRPTLGTRLSVTDCESVSLRRMPFRLTLSPSWTCTDSGSDKLGGLDLTSTENCRSQSRSLVAIPSASVNGSLSVIVILNAALLMPAFASKPRLPSARLNAFGPPLSVRPLAVFATNTSGVPARERLPLAVSTVTVRFLLSVSAIVIELDPVAAESVVCVFAITDSKLCGRLKVGGCRVSNSIWYVPSMFRPCGFTETVSPPEAVASSA